MTRRDRSSDRLLMRSDQLELMDRSLEQQAIERERDDVDDARRAEYLERLRAALPELRKIEGFPIGSDEDILALSDPPFYTACPNPFLAEFIAEHGTPYDEATDDYHREPFAADVSEGKNDPIYNAHSYHTKVPHKAIMRYLLHYTKPGDIVFDGFCGTGMTGVAAQLCGSPDPDFRAKVEAEWAASGHQKPEWGARRAVLGDLSPAATFIAYNLNVPVDSRALAREATQISDGAAFECAGMYESAATDGTRGQITYTVWSDVFVCPGCGHEMVWWDLAVDESTKVIRETVACPGCGYQADKRQLTHAMTTYFDDLMQHSARVPKQVPVRVVFEVNGRRHTQAGDGSSDGYGEVYAGGRTEKMMFRDPPWGDQYREGYHQGITHAHQFFTPRNWHAWNALWSRAASAPTARLRLALMFSLTAVQRLSSRLTKVGLTYLLHGGGGAVNAGINGTLYLPSVTAEQNPFVLFGSRIRTLLRGGLPSSSALRSDCVGISTQSISPSTLPPEAIDYIFLDPPFGDNLQYAELNFLSETALGVWTRQEAEAVVSRTFGRTLPLYQDAMTRAFESCHLVLKPGRWMTVEFHNSSNSVWNAIQEAIQRAKFVVADVRVLDKKQGAFNAVNAAGAVKQDLVISAYKPRAGFEQRFALEAGTEQGAWDFIREHLGLLPVFVDHDGRVEVVAERQNYLLYDRMVAFHIQRGATVPLSAGHFYAGLNQRFLERDDMYFTELQAAEYDRRRLEARDVEQLSVFVVDEKSAIQWIRAELLAASQTFQDIQPKFLRELNQNRFEELPELRDILDENFLEDPATHRWRVPDPGKQADLEALRIRALLNEFATYVTGTAKLKRFRLEAIRAGFADLWAKRDYRAIIKLAERLPDEVVQEDPALLMYYDNAVTREGAG